MQAARVGVTCTTLHAVNQAAHAHDGGRLRASPRCESGARWKADTCSTPRFLRLMDLRESRQGWLGAEFGAERLHTQALNN